MTDAPLTPDDEIEALAAEFVLGVLSLEDRAAAETRAKRDASFAASIIAWENHFAGLNDEFDTAPAPDLLRKIEARLFPTAPPARAGRRSPGGWFGWMTGAGTGLAIIVAAMLAMAPQRPDLVAVLATEDNSLRYESRYLDRELIVTRLAGTDPAEGQVHELWIIAPDMPPVSLGLLGDRPLVVDYPLPPKGWVLAVTIEPAGGAPGGVPTGPIILKTVVGSGST